MYLTLFMHKEFLPIFLIFRIWKTVQRIVCHPTLDTQRWCICVRVHEYVVHDVHHFSTPKIIIHKMSGCFCLSIFCFFFVVFFVSVIFAHLTILLLLLGIGHANGMASHPFQSHHINLNRKIDRIFLQQSFGLIVVKNKRISVIVLCESFINAYRSRFTVVHPVPINQELKTF